MYDCAIIGAGPAGLAAAIYLRRFHCDVCTVDSGASRALKIPRTCNYPGFPGGISGQDLLALLRRQFQLYGGAVLRHTISQVEHLEGGGFRVQADHANFSARRLLLATGVVDVDPQLEGLDEAKASGLYRYCPICDGYEFSDRKIAVIGKDEHGANEAIFLQHFTGNVHFIVIEEPPDERLMASVRSKGIPLIQGKGRRLYIEPKPHKQVVLEMQDGSRHTFDGLYSSLGNKVRSGLALALGAKEDGQGCLQVTDSMETSVTGRYAAGDVVSSLDQIAVATGQAAIAATAIHNSLPFRSKTSVMQAGVQ